MFRIIALLLVEMVLCANFSIYKKNGQILAPKNETHARETVKCGTTYEAYFQSSQRLVVRGDQPFTVSVSSNNNHIHISGYAQSLEEGQKNHIGEIILWKECRIQQHSTQIAYSLQFHIKSSSHHQVMVKAVSFCNGNGSVQQLGNAISIIYQIIWATSLSFMPVFPLSNYLPLKIIVMAYIGTAFFISLPQFIILIIMRIVFKYSADSGEIRREVNHDSGQEASFSQKASITLSLSLIFFLIIIFLFQISYGSYYFYQVTLFQNTSIHLFNFLYLLLNIQLFCRVVWLNRLRDLFWWIVGTYIFFTFFSSLLNQSPYTITNLLNPNLFSQQCQFKDVSFLIAMTPVSLYFKRENSNWQIFSTILLLVCLLLDFPASFWVSMVVVMLWFISHSLVYGFTATIRFRWLPYNYNDLY